jgi:homocysteine S-methyltransferase
MKLLIETGADLLACETIPCIDEAIAITEVLAEFPETTAWISFSCKDGSHLCSGERFRDAVEFLDKASQVVAIGVNCTAPQYIEALIKIGKANSGKPILVYPNKGEVYDAADKVWLPATAHPAHFIDDARVWYDAGSTIIGGCCRTTPADIGELKQLAQFP